MNVVIIGGGAAGCIAALTSVKQGHNVTLIEKNNELGKKMKITGKGRCNLTFNGDFDFFQKNICVNSKFMYSSFNNFSNTDTLEFFNNLGIETKLERGNRFFLKSDNASELVNSLKKELEKSNVKIMYNTSVEKINLRSM
ncbi:MAG: NAD(P)/FAD-dependent oxidoreductase [Oscillospiraceae bacterium]|nr:NAD(P)/FAD-dependent oxidoreductase [Oscillospiraceae bacterium]